MGVLLYRWLRPIGLGFSVLLLLSCFFYHVSFPFLPGADALSIAVPGLILGNLFFGVVWALGRKSAAVAPLSGLLAAGVSFGLPWGFGSQGSVPSTAGLTVMSYNVRGFNATRHFEPRDAGEQIVALVKEEDPAVICFQEYNRTYDRDFEYYRDWFITPAASGKTSQAIYSKYPIVKVGSIPFPGSNNNAIFADILYQRDTLRIYNVHMQSYKISSRGFLLRNYGLDFLMRLNGVAAKHREQAALVRDHMMASPYPSILCGDFNATAYSRPYRIISKGLQDSFREAGSGWGTTYYLNQILPYRIDFILASRDFQVLVHRNIHVLLSDHLPVMATLEAQAE